MLLSIASILFSQNSVFANPFYDILSIKDDFPFRPYLNSEKKISITSNFIIGNSTSPNFDNFGNLYLMKGKNGFVSLNIAYSSKNLILIVEPYSIHKENKKIPNLSRGGRYVYTNEMRNISKRPFHETGLRESLLFLHLNYMGFGISNMNQWLGPGVHNTLTMTNNTKGFPHLFVGTLKNKRLNEILSFNTRYTFSKINNRAGGVYYTSFSTLFQFDLDITYRFGFIRDFLSGGKSSNSGESILQEDAMTLVFGPLFSDSKRGIAYTTNWGFEPWDQQLSGFFEIIPDEKSRIYIEIGTGDHRKNFSDLKANWDHNLAYVLGMRIQFDSFLNTESILAGAEYATLTGNSNTRKFRGSGPWYDNWWYDYSSYDGRRWGAHSGSDSDDFIVYLGLNFKSKSFTTFFSKERKGLLLEQFPELKYELLFNYTQKINQNINLKVFLEAEIHDNYFFVQQQERTDMAILLNLEYVIK